MPDTSDFHKPNPAKSSEVAESAIQAPQGRVRRRLPRIPSREQYYRYLFIALVLLTLAYPIITVWPAGRAIEQVVLAGVLITGTLATYKRRSQIVLTAIVLAIMISSAIGVELKGGETNWPMITFLSSITGFLILVTWMLSHDIFSSRGQINADLLFGAVSVYFLIGTSFALAHYLVETLAPGSYTCTSSQCVGFPRTSAYVYFSFVTLSTVGYGDISPNTRIAGTLSYVEAIVGQMYLAILVARLVGMQIASGIEHR